MLFRSLSALVLLAALVATPTQAQACPNGVSIGLSVGIQIPGGMILIGYDGGRALYGYPSRGPYAYGYVEHGRWFRYHNPYYVHSGYWTSSYRSHYAPSHHSSSHHSYSSSTHRDSDWREDRAEAERAQERREEQREHSNHSSHSYHRPSPSHHGADQRRSSDHRPDSHGSPPNHRPSPNGPSGHHLVPVHRR